MYRIKDFKIGDEVYLHKNSNWEYCGKIVKVTGGLYGMKVPKITGIVMTRKGIFERQGYIGKSVN